MGFSGFTALELVKNGNTGNRMFQYAYLRRLQSLLPASEIYGADILDFVPRSAGYSGSGKRLVIPKGQIHPLEALAQTILTEGIEHLRFGGYVQRMEYLLPPGQMRSLFSLPGPLDTERFQSLTSDDHITCVVRANEILRAVHPDYPPTPIAFFRAAVEDSGRIPVLVGQTADSFYMDALRQLFPHCVVLDHKDPVEDFRFILNSTNVAIAVSTFAWMAAYLSASARRIYMPEFGFLNPKQRGDIDLSPTNDARYRFARFEKLRWTADEAQIRHVLNPDLPMPPFRAQGPATHSALPRQGLGAGAPMTGRDTDRRSAPRSPVVPP